jgi:hypothetical protein
VWEAWVGQGGKGSREEVDKGRGHQDARAEVLADEEEVSSAFAASFRQVLGEDGESTGCWASQLARGGIARVGQVYNVQTVLSVIMRNSAKTWMAVS